jgi:DNA-binding response OmpR family regulator
MVEGLARGADDYITKPFSLAELAARVDALLRRTRTVPALLGSGRLCIDTGKSVATKDGRELALTPSEMKLLLALMGWPGKVFTRAELIELALGDEFDGFDRTIDSHVKNLRQKIEDDPANPSYIQTIHGVGYRFEEE